MSRENHLKGLSAEEWARSASAYLYDLGTIQPFLAGNEIALQEFAVELARKNNLSLQWDATAELAVENADVQVQLLEQSANLRRMVMLAMDTNPISSETGPGQNDRARNRADRFPGESLAVEEIELHGVHLGYAVTERHISVDETAHLRLPRICKQISLTLVVTLLLAAGGYYYAITPHHTSAPPESAEGLLDRADTLSWVNRWAEAEPLYRRAEALFTAQRNPSKAHTRK